MCKTGKTARTQRSDCSATAQMDQGSVMPTHLAFNVGELGKHQRPVEGQLSHVVVVLSRG